MYFAWGETEGYTGDDVNNGVKQFNWANYKWCNGSNTTLTKYNNDSSKGAVDNLTTLELEDDAAYQSDNSCRMPTKSDLEELTANTTSTWETLNGVNGRRFTSKTNGNSIFVPAAGFCSNGSVINAGLFGFYWGSSLDENSKNSIMGCNLNFDSSIMGILGIVRSEGLSVRPVKD